MKTTRCHRALLVGGLLIYPGDYLVEGDDGRMRCPDVGGTEPADATLMIFFGEGVHLYFGLRWDDNRWRLHFVGTEDTCVA